MARANEVAQDAKAGRIKPRSRPATEADVRYALRDALWVESLRRARSTDKAAGEEQA